MNWSDWSEVLLTTLDVWALAAFTVIVVAIAAIPVAGVYYLIAHLRWNYFRHPVKTLDSWWEGASPKRRLDRNAGNTCMLLGLMAPTLSIILTGPAPSSIVAGMPVGLQVLMCACIFVGCGVKLHGSLCGSRWYFPNTNLKQAYRYGYSGAPAAVIGMGVYSYFIFMNLNSFWSAIGAMLTPMLGLGIGIQAVLYWLESRRIARNEKIMIQILEREL